MANTEVQVGIHLTLLSRRVKSRICLCRFAEGTLAVMHLGPMSLDNNLSKIARLGRMSGPNFRGLLET